MFSFFKKKAVDASDAENIAFSAIMTLLSENDILELELLHNGAVLKIGVSSDYDHRSKPEYFDKRYYIGETEYLSPAEFSRAFASLSTQTMQTVLRIDGAAPKHYHFDR
ncbi:MAG: hypothetical protein E7451_05525 [Ruminococcaceae bacterium]|nr:hypothetical protein [Oscillospiraceae bacterium]